MPNGPLWFVFHQNQLLINAEHPKDPIVTESTAQKLNLSIISKHDIGNYHNKPCFGVEVEFNENQTLPDNLKFMPLRQAALTILSQELFHLAGRAAQIIEWHKTHQFCGKCGVKLFESKVERAKVCPDCNYHFYPRISPSIIVLIKRGKEILLARSPHFSEKIYSTLAGFIEPGESAEEAVHREVLEEVGLRVKNLKYRGSQPWPFPNSLMLGYTAEHAAGEIVIDGVEIEDAGWFSVDKLPQLPYKISIAHELINLFINQEF
ncbi:MAG TPA: NAD(+) diphosphatase [Gammaproteobacteria bacterium]|nr:NAD(+) diphosphatase [Gammaproteobacteria bacterium]